jgi:hypothetical protein
MANVCIVRHQGYIKSKIRFPYQHNFRTLKNYGNKNIDASLTHLNTCIVNNLKDGKPISLRSIVFMKAENLKGS